MNTNNLITQSYLGSSLVAENCQKIKVNELVRQATKDLKKRLVETQIESLGVPVALTTSKTRFSGERLWFVCPTCSRRAGVIFRTPANSLGCRRCLCLIYKQQRYKVMIELQ